MNPGNHVTTTTLATLLQTAITTRSTSLGRSTHAIIIKTLTPQPPTFLSNHIINMYSKLNLLTSAHLTLSHLPPPSRSVVTWTSLISGTVQNHHYSTAMAHFINMRRESLLPNDFTYPCLFKACNGLKMVGTGKQVHGLAVKTGHLGDVFVGCSCFDMYCKMGRKAEACKVFEEMPVRNLVTWNAYMANAVLDGESGKACKAFVEVRRGGGEVSEVTFCVVLNACCGSDTGLVRVGRQVHGVVVRCGFDGFVSVANGLVDFYGKCRDVVSASLVFDAMRERNGVSWCSMVAAYEQNDEGEKACMLFLEAMRNNVEAKDFIVSSVVSACAGITGLEMGRLVHGLAVKACIDGNVFVGSALVDMYAKCGNVDDCERMFDEMPERNLITWNALLGGYAHLGHADMALALFEEMKCGGVIPNYVTFVSILSACSRAGAVDVGLTIFETMKSKYGIDAGVEHYACVVDMLARAGMVERAYELIKKMPLDPTVSMWGSLLGASKVHRNNRLGKIAADNLFKLDPHDSGNYVILSNMFAAAGRWEEANVVRMEMKDVGINKGAGCSWITIKNTVHTFQAKDTCHERNADIQAMLSKLKMQMKGAGYTADTSLALFDLEEEERESEVWHHSEKIALAFGLCVVPNGLPIRITKNLRICFDCHTAFKFISGITNREIIVRDNNRFHRFTKYECSCKDYW